jgi:hypothetical protein
MKVDETGKAVEVNYPYLETGKDEYVASLGFNTAMTYWAEFTTTMFGKSPELKKVTYVGLLDDQPVLKIATTREQFDSKLSTVQETIASYSAITFAKLGLHKNRRQGREEGSGAAQDQDLQGGPLLPPEGPGHGLAQAEVAGRAERSAVRSAAA